MTDIVKKVSIDARDFRLSDHNYSKAIKFDPLLAQALAYRCTNATSDLASLRRVVTPRQILTGAVIDSNHWKANTAQK